MNWEAIGAVGEIIGATGVIASLMYLAIQIRSDAAAKRADTSHAQSKMLADAQNSIAASPGLAEVFHKGVSDYAALTGPEKVRFNAAVGSTFRAFEDTFHRHTEGHLDEKLWHGIDKPIDDFINTPGIRVWWGIRKDWFSVEFKEHVESKMEEEFRDLYESDA
jgi:hypothetical protein